MAVEPKRTETQQQPTPAEPCADPTEVDEGLPAWGAAAIAVGAVAAAWYLTMLVLLVTGTLSTGSFGFQAWRRAFEQLPTFARDLLGAAAIPVVLVTMLAAGVAVVARSREVVTVRERDLTPVPRRAVAVTVAVVVTLAVAYALVQVQFNTYVGYLTPDPNGPYQRVAPNFAGDVISGLNQFDGPEYADISRTGYEQRQLVWFPLYPMLMKLGGTETNGPELVGVLISVAAGAAAAVGLLRWSAIQALDRRARVLTLAVALLYPYAWYLYGAVYADALFVALAIGAFVLVERDRLLLAGALTALATATRPAGFAVAIGLTAVALQRSGVLIRADRPGTPEWMRAIGLPLQLDPSRWRARLLAPSIGWAGLMGYMTYQWLAFGSPLRFISEQANYHEPGTASMLKLQFFDAWSQGGFDGRHLATTTFQFVLLCAVVVSVPLVARRFGWGYGLYTFLVALLPAVSVSTFMGVGRYLLPAFPCAALAGEWLARRPVARTVWLASSAAALGVMAIGFSRSWYLS